MQQQYANQVRELVTELHTNEMRTFTQISKNDGKHIKKALFIVMGCVT